MTTGIGCACLWRQAFSWVGVHVPALQRQRLALESGAVVRGTVWVQTAHSGETPQTSTGNGTTEVDIWGAASSLAFVAEQEAESLRKGFLFAWMSTCSRLRGLSRSPPAVLLLLFFLCLHVSLG